MLPRGPSFFHDCLRLQLLEYLYFLAIADRGIPPWTGQVRFEYRIAGREVVMAGRIESIFPDDGARRRLVEYCQAVALMLQAYAQLPDTPPFSVALEFEGEWVGGRAESA